MTKDWNILLPCSYVQGVEAEGHADVKHDMDIFPLSINSVIVKCLEYKPAF